MYDPLCIMSLVLRIKVVLGLAFAIKGGSKAKRCPCFFEKEG